MTIKINEEQCQEVMQIEDTRYFVYAFANGQGVILSQKDNQEFDYECYKYRYQYDERIQDLHWAWYADGDDEEDESEDGEPEEDLFRYSYFSN